MGSNGAAPGGGQAGVVALRARESEGSQAEEQNEKVGEAAPHRKTMGHERLQFRRWAGRRRRRSGIIEEFKMQAFQAQEFGALAP